MQNQFGLPQLVTPLAPLFIFLSYEKCIHPCTITPHKSSLEHQAQVRVQDFTILIWCQLGWDAWVLVSRVKPIEDNSFQYEDMRTKGRGVCHLHTWHSAELLKFPIQKWKMAGTLVHSNSEIQPDACCPSFNRLSPNYRKASTWPFAVPSELFILSFSWEMSSACSS